MKALLKTGETIEIIPNDDFCAAKYINKETSEYVFNDEIVEIINEESGKPMNQEGLEAEIQRVVENYNKLVNGSKVMKPSGIEKIARHFAQWGAEHAKEELMNEAVVGVVTNADGVFGYDVANFRFDDNHTYSILLPHEEKRKYGDEVSLIILPKED